MTARSKVKINPTEAEKASRSLERRKMLKENISKLKVRISEFKRDPVKSAKYQASLDSKMAEYDRRTKELQEFRDALSESI